MDKRFSCSVARLLRAKQAYIYFTAGVKRSEANVSALWAEQLPSLSVLQ